MSTQVLIVGGGVAALEALLALRTLAGDRAELTLISPEEWFVDRPVTVAEPFGLASAARHSLPEIAAELGAGFVRTSVTAVAGEERRVECADGADISFETLILAPGARATAPFPGAIAFGLPGSSDEVSEMLRRLRGGRAHSVAFVARSTTGWLLPLYELALMTARELAAAGGAAGRVRLLTPEDRPLEMFGERASDSVGRLLSAAGVEFVGADSGAREVMGGQPADADYVVTLPALRGPELPGVPATHPHGFVPVDEFGRVEGLAGAYAAGDAVDFPIKQGGLAAQQADTVAAHVAASYGADVEPSPFRPVLRGMLFTGDEPRFLRSGAPGSDATAVAWYPLWWPATKVAGRYLAPYLFARTDEDGFVPRPEGFVDVEIPLTEVTLPG